MQGDQRRPGHFAHDRAQQRIDETNAIMRREFEKEKHPGRLRADIDLGVTAVQLTSRARGVQIQWL